MVKKVFVISYFINFFVDASPSVGISSTSQLICKCDESYRTIVRLKHHHKLNKSCRDDFKVKCTCCFATFWTLAGLTKHLQYPSNLFLYFYLRSFALISDPSFSHAINLLYGLIQFI